MEQEEEKDVTTAECDKGAQKARIKNIRTGYRGTINRNSKVELR